MKSESIIIIPAYNKYSFIKNSLEKLKNIDNFDLLVVDDGSDDETDTIFENNSWLKSIKHEYPFGYGASFISAYEYARDNQYKIMITLDPDNDDFIDDLNEIINNINYGYDIVSCSRILENYNYSKISEMLINQTSQISEAIKRVTNLDITDPLSGIKGYQIDSLKNMELGESGHAILLQIWIQALHFRLNVMEIPSVNVNSFGSEFNLDENNLDYMLSLIETEKHLYIKGEIN